ncbi:hypothetical protein SESBI_46471 [Sesbania bispinosa]|nr:hypothetical protein SESBI_46471 [Sesbania bispinosa]
MEVDSNFNFQPEEIVRMVTEELFPGVIVRLMGKRVGIRFMSLELKHLWAKKGDVRTMDISEDFFFIRFSEEGDYKHALYERPWLIADHYLLVQRWRLLFNPEDYAIDENTSIHTRSRFPRICIEVDLRDKLIPYFNALGRTFKVEYERLHMICFECGKYRHKSDPCPERRIAIHQEGLVQDHTNQVCLESQQQNMTDLRTGIDSDEAIFGPQLLVKRTPRKRFKSNSQTSDTTQVINTDTNLPPQKENSTRFDVLQTRPEDSKKSNLEKGKIPSSTRQLKPNTNRPSTSHQTTSKTQKYNPIHQKKNIPYQKDQQQKVQVIKKNKDWEKEIMAMMNRYHKRRWDAHSKGDYVGDLFSLDKKQFFETLYGNSSTGIQGYMGHSDLDKPPDYNVIDVEASNLDEQDKIIPESGAGAKIFLGLIRDLSRMYHLNFVSLLEPRISGSKVDKTIKGNFKAPGPDGIHALFYKSQWGIMESMVFANMCGNGKRLQEFNVFFGNAFMGNFPPMKKDPAEECLMIILASDAMIKLNLSYACP